ncbi:hypothetical protein PGB90_006398 [Kerria lacca]
MLFTYKQFEFCLYCFKKSSDYFKDEWSICHISNSSNDNIYLKKKVLKSYLWGEKSLIICWEYNIIYSFSYSVPILYFNACFDNGKLLSVNDIEILVHDVFKQQLQENKLGIFSQQEHPYTRTPFFILHPCKTENFLKPIVSISSNINPLVTWLSAIAPVVDLNIDPRYGTVCFNKEKFDSLSNNINHSEI